MFPYGKLVLILAIPPKAYIRRKIWWGIRFAEKIIFMLCLE